MYTKLFFNRLSLYVLHDLLFSASFAIISLKKYYCEGIMKTLTLDEFLRSFKQNMDLPHSILLGAGASIESGVKSASDCIWDWKRDIVVSNMPTRAPLYSNTKSSSVRKNIQSWLNDQGIYPKENDDSEYSFYAEKAYPLLEDRCKYFQNLFLNANPSLGYHLIAYMAEQGIFKSVWTTNFDGLMEKCAHQYNLTPVSIKANCIDRFYKIGAQNELMILPLHGDYKYGELKNTAEELDSQNDAYIKALIHDLTNKDLIIIGYSGRDASLINALKKAYSEVGSGRLFWCGYGSQINSHVVELIDFVNSHERTAYYIASNGFDEMLYEMATICYAHNQVHLEKIKSLKTKLSTDVATRSTNFISFSPLTINKIADTNLYPFSFPDNCYQFEVEPSSQRDIWKICKSLLVKNIIAVPYNGMVYAWGDKKNLLEQFGKNIKGSIILTPLTKESVFSISVLKNLVLQCITFLLAKNVGLDCSRQSIWDDQQTIKITIDNKEIIGYKGIRLSIISHGKYSYIAFSPDFQYSSDCILTKNEKKIFADYFSLAINNGKPNKNIHQYINYWVRRLIPQTQLLLYFPLNTVENSFKFKFNNTSANIKISNNSQYEIDIPKEFNHKRLILSGTECNDPLLQFYNPLQNKPALDFHPMRGLIKNAPIEMQSKISNSIKNGISLGVICPHKHNDNFYQFLTKLNTSCDVKYNIEYVLPFPGFSTGFKTALNIPISSSQEWKEIVPTHLMTAIEFGEIIAKKLDQLSALSLDVVVIYIPKEYDHYTTSGEGDNLFDLHDYIKAYAAQKQIATQFIREATIESDLMCQVLWALSLAIYVKSNRTPWLVSNTRKDTAFAGIGYSVKNTASGSNIIIGCSHIYSADGQGLKYKLSKINDVTFDKKKNPYLSENEAYKLGLNIKELFYNSFSEMPRRVVIHKRTPFKEAEIKGLTESLSLAGIHEIELVEISYEDNIKCFAYEKDMYNMSGFPIKRGLCFPINKTTMLLYTHGIAPSIRNPHYSYVQGGKTIPLPLKVVSHYGNSSMQEIATEILGLSKMNWNSFGLYTKLPCTIDSSNEIARVGWLLSQYEGALYEYRFFM